MESPTRDEKRPIARSKIHDGFPSKSRGESEIDRWLDGIFFTGLGRVVLPIAKSFITYLDFPLKHLDIVHPLLLGLHLGRTHSLGNITEEYDTNVS